MIRCAGLAFIASIVWVGPAQAGPRDAVMAGIARCAPIKDDRAWLDCVHDAEAPMRGPLGPPARAAAPSAMADTQPAASPEAGGFFQTLAGEAPPLAVSTLAAVAYDRDGAFIATLRNGQVWRQTDEGPRKAPLRPGARVTIIPGALWSYELKTEDSPKRYKVERHM